MVLKLQIIRDGKLIFEIPLEPRIREDVFSDLLATELRESDIKETVDFFGTFANETRLKMLKRMMLSASRFSDFMREFKLNPKVVNENLKRFKERGIIQKDQRRRYSISPTGFGCIFTLFFALRRIMEELE